MRMLIVVALVAGLAGCGAGEAPPYKVSSGSVDSRVTIFRGPSGDTCVSISDQDVTYTTFYQLTDDGPVEKSPDSLESYYGEDGFNCAVRNDDKSYKMRDGALVPSS